MNFVLFSSTIRINCIYPSDIQPDGKAVEGVFLWSIDKLAIPWKLKLEAKPFYFEYIFIFFGQNDFEYIDEVNF